MEYVVLVDERGRLVLPGALRKSLNLKGRSRVVLRLRDDGVVELIPLCKLRREVEEVFREKFRDWREEDHEASKLLRKMVTRIGDS